MVFILSFRAGIYGTETGLFSRKINLLFLLACPRVLQAVLPPFFRSYEKSTKKVRRGCAHPLDSRGRRKTLAPLCSAGFTAILELPQFVETQ